VPESDDPRHGALIGLLVAAALVFAWRLALGQAGELLDVEQRVAPRALKDST
jgi:hypothetical protein